MEKASKTFFEKLNIQILDTLEEGQIIALPTTKEGLKQLHFTCPLCKQRKTADNITRIVTPLQITQEPKKCVVSQKQLLCCSECSDKYFPIHKWSEE